MTGAQGCLSMQHAVPPTPVPRPLQLESLSGKCCGSGASRSGRRSAVGRTASAVGGEASPEVSCRPESGRVVPGALPVVMRGIARLRAALLLSRRLPGMTA